MSEQERAEALKSIQLELFQLKQDYLLRSKKLKRQLVLIQGCGQKQCRRCRETMDVEQFALDPRYRDSRYSYCHECKSEMNRLRRKIKRIGEERLSVIAA